MFSGCQVAECLSWLLSLTPPFICVSTPHLVPHGSISNIHKVYREKDSVVEALRGDTS